MRGWLRRPVVLGTLAALITAAVGITAVLLLTGDDESQASVRTEDRNSTTTSTTRGSGSSTTKPTASTTKASAAGGSSATTPSTQPAVTTTTTEPPDPPDPSDAYHEVPLPAGVTASITSCGWSPANGGELRATGTVTWSGADDEAWFIEPVWLTLNQTQYEDITSRPEVHDFTPGETYSWNIGIEQASAPPNLKCALEIS